MGRNVVFLVIASPLYQGAQRTGRGWVHFREIDR